jgi:hypothetical protein
MNTNMRIHFCFLSLALISVYQRFTLIVMSVVSSCLFLILSRGLGAGGFLFQSRHVEPAGEFGLDFGKLHVAHGEQDQEVVNHISGFADDVLAALFAWFAGCFDDLGGFFGDFGADLRNAAGEQFGRVRFLSVGGCFAVVNRLFELIQRTHGSRLAVATPSLGEDQSHNEVS